MVRIAIIVSEFNPEVTGRMLAKAQDVCKKNSVEVVETVRVPGAYDIALIASELAKRSEIQAVVCLGAIIQGETGHDKIIAQALAKSLHEISIENRTPVLLGVIGPQATQKQAEDRAEEYGERAVLSAINMIDTMKGLVG